MIAIHFDLPALRAIQGIDCSMRKCASNAYCSGRARWNDGQFEVETACDDCRTTGYNWTPATQRLGEALRNADRRDHDAIAREFVQSRPAGPHPLRDP